MNHALAGAIAAAALVAVALLQSAPFERQEPIAAWPFSAGPHKETELECASVPPKKTESHLLGNQWEKGDSLRNLV